MSFRILVECACQCSGGCRSESDARNEVETAGARAAWGGGLRQAPLRAMPNKIPTLRISRWKLQDSRTSAARTIIL